MNYEVDEKDWKIINILKEHGDYKIRKIAKKTLLPVTTVHNRIKKLKENGIIKRFTIELNYKKLGIGIYAYILISVDYKSLKENKKDQHALAKEIKEIRGVERVDVLTGEKDIIANVRVKDVEELDELILRKIRSIPGVEKTETSVVLYSAE